MRLIVLFFLLNAFASSAQNFYSGPLIQILKSSKINSELELKSSAEFRKRIFQDLEQDHSKWNSSQQRVSFQSILETNNLSNLNYGIGAMFRLNYRAENQFRAIQQISHKYNLFSLKAGSRLRVDETWQNNNELTIRLRYRYSVQLPLNGFVLDNKEWYLKSGIELLGIFETSRTLETRYLINIGSLRKKQTKAEFGVDYRIRYLANTNHTIWLNMNLYIN